MSYKAWDVYLGRRLIETVFFNEKCDGGAKITAEDVKRSLVNHDGYPAEIRVIPVR